MTNLKKSFEEEAMARGDTLRQVVVGQDDRDDSPARWERPTEDYKVQSWEDGSKELDYEYDSGYGGADCHAVIAWGDRFVYCVHEYDGATGIVCLPRNAEPCRPFWGGLV